MIDATVDPAHPRVIVRYRRFDGAAWAATPVAPAGVSPTGHDCYANGPIGNYLESGCEHYGVSLNASPTRTSYRWLVAADPVDPNTTFTAEPQPVDLPVPVWNVVPNPGGGVAVRAEVEPVEEEQHAQHGDQVTIEELIAMVRIALGEAEASSCAAGDGNGDGAIAIDELVLAVARALNGCG